MDKLHKQGLFVNFKPQLIDAGLPAEQREAMLDGILLGVLAVCGLGPNSYSYQFDESSIAQIEKFLDEQHRHRVVKWKTNSATPKRIITTDGAQTTSKRQIERYESFLETIGLLYAYCVANVTGGTIVLRDGAAAVMPPDHSLASFPVGKVFKFLKNGEEDSLVGFLAAIRAKKTSHPESERAKQNILAQLAAMGVELPDTHRWQEWHDTTTGALTKVMLLDRPSDEGGKVLAEAHVGEDSFARDYLRRPIEQQRHFLQSDEGQYLIQHVYGEPDEQGMCKRADFMEEDAQLEALRGYWQRRTSEDGSGADRPEGTALH